MATVRVELRVLGEPVSAEVPAPDGPVRLDSVLPLLRQLDDRIVELAARRAEAERGEPVSCRKGCSACCRAQPVPVTPPEAYALARLVEGLPEPRRTAVRERFAANARRLDEAGLKEFFLGRDREEVTADEARGVARRYLGLGLACPFLEDDACGIYPDRPFVCRQYLVTSPAEWCRNPLDNPVRPVPTAARFGHAALELSDKYLGPPRYTVPLALALEYAERHRGELERTFPAEAVFRESLAALTRAEEDD
jgi:Fe-S-cluster containining protein